MWAVAAWAMITISFLGAALCVAGLRGRRVGDHPYCRACGFDLFGGPTGPRKCPECGGAVDVAGWDGIVIGRHERRGRLLAVGLTVLLFSAPIAAGMLYVLARPRVWREQRPAALVLWEAQGPSARGSNLGAVNELFRRYRVGTLSDEHALRFARQLLDWQARGEWSSAATELVVDLFVRGLLPESEFERYVAQRWQPKLVVRPRVGAGDPVTVDVSCVELVRPHEPKAHDVPATDILSVTIDGRAAALLPPLPRGKYSSSVAPAKLIDGAAVADGPGGHEVAVTFQYRCDFVGRVPQRTVTTTLGSRFEVLPAGDASVAVDPDANVARAVEREARSLVTQLEASPDAVYELGLVSDPPPRDLTPVQWCHSVWLRDGEKPEEPIGWLIGRHPAGSAAVLTVNPGRLRYGQEFEIVLRPDVARARLTTDIDAPFGEAVFKLRFDR